LINVSKFLVIISSINFNDLSPLKLQEKGVNITEPKKQDWGGIMSHIKDQDDNILTLLSSYEDHAHNK
jgi:hypothetical protein